MSLSYCNESNWFCCNYNLMRNLLLIKIIGAISRYSDVNITVFQVAVCRMFKQPAYGMARNQKGNVKKNESI